MPIQSQFPSTFWQTYILYLLRATFLVDTSAPLPTPYNADVGTISLDASMPALTSIVSGELVISGQPTNGTNVIRSTTQFTSAAGRVFHIKLTSRSTTSSSRIGWGDGVSGMRVGLLNLTTQVQPFFPNGSISGVNVPTTATEFFFVLTDNGGHVIANENGTKKLLWTSRNGTSNAYAQIWAYPFSNITLKSDEWEVYDLAAPYNSDYGIATARVASPGVDETITGAADAMIEITWTPGAGEIETLEFRRIDASNLFKLVCDQAAATIKLYRRQAGVDTELNSGKTQTWTSGTPYRIVVRADGSNISTWVDLIGKHNVTDTFNQTATGIVTSLGGSNLVAWPLTIPAFFL